MQISDGFGGGMARCGEVCGAVVGAVILIGLLFGREQAEDMPAKEKTYSLINSFFNDFKKAHRSVVCKELLNCDISTEKGRDEAIKNDLFSKLCPKYIQSSVKILGTMLNVS